MKHGLAALLALGALGLAPAKAAGCGQTVRLSVEPAGKTAEVAATLRRRLAAAGERTPSVETAGGGLTVVLPPGDSESLLTRPAKIEFRLVAKSPDEPGAVLMPRLDGKGSEAVEPQIIVDEYRMRDLKVVDAAKGGPPAIAFRLEPLAVKNLMAATVEAVGRKLAILVDDRIVADPIIRAPVASVQGQISGGFTKESAEQLVDLIRNGRLAARVAVASRAPAPCMTH
jgi:preprotein translocase subunit SecD